MKALLAAILTLSLARFATAQVSEEIGKWGGDITQAILPDQFEVDFVRVYDLVP